MSKGPGRVERAIRALIEQEQSRLLKRHERNDRYASADYVSITGWQILHAAYPSVDGPWTKAQKVSAFRAMHRIVAGQEHWTVEHRPRQAKMAGVDQVLPLRFRWQPPPGPPKPKPKPVKVHEEIWASVLNGDTGREDRSRAVITSRGGAEPNRITVEWGGRRWQAHEYRWGISVSYPEPPRSPPLLRWPPPPPPRPKFWRTQAEAKAQQCQEREFRRQFKFVSRADDGASAEALALLDLAPPSRGRMCRRHSAPNP